MLTKKKIKNAAFKVLPFLNQRRKLYMKSIQHCFMADLPWIIEQIFQCARKAVFITVSCRYAYAVMPNGEQAHISMRAPAWWDGLISGIANKHPDIDYILCCDSPDIKGRKTQFWFDHGLFKKTPEQIQTYFR